MDLTEKTVNTNRHPWELSRADCILKIIRKYPLHAAADIGAGDCFFASKLAALVSGPVYAADKEYSEKPEPVEGICRVNAVSGIPELTGGMILMDVLEHIGDDSSFLAGVLEKTADNGLVLVTVPAFQFLFSAHDVFLKHCRRYNRKRLLALLGSHNVRVKRCHYFYCSLFLARLLTLLPGKKNKRRQTGIGEWPFPESGLVTRIVTAVLNLDFHICAFFAGLHIYLPGLSLLAVCEKNSGGKK
jgi:hypothetical protein